MFAQIACLRKTYQELPFDKNTYFYFYHKTVFFYTLLQKNIFPNLTEHFAIIKMK